VPIAVAVPAAAVAVAAHPYPGLATLAYVTLPACRSISFSSLWGQQEGQGSEGSEGVLGSRGVCGGCQGVRGLLQGSMLTADCSRGRQRSCSLHGMQRCRWHVGGQRGGVRRSLCMLFNACWMVGSVIMEGTACSRCGVQYDGTQHESLLSSISAGGACCCWLSQLLTSSRCCQACRRWRCDSPRGA
jgi:hypothetical protein